MPVWLHTRGRAVLSLLSDLGGALAFVILAVALIAAAATGTLLFAIDAVPQPFFTMLVLGIALLAAGLTLHFFGDRLVPSPPPPAPTTSQEGDEAHLVGTVVDNPYARAAAAQRQHVEKKALDEAAERVRNVRRALRLVREELLDNRRFLQRIHEDEVDKIHQLTFEQWEKQENVLLELEDPEPHSLTREAYRGIAGVKDFEYAYNPHTGFWEKKDFPEPVLNTDVYMALEAVDAAVESLSAAEKTD